jgi:hypothetical protein
MAAQRSTRDEEIAGQRSPDVRHVGPGGNIEAALTAAGHDRLRAAEETAIASGVEVGRHRERLVVASPARQRLPERSWCRGDTQMVARRACRPGI